MNIFHSVSRAYRGDKSRAGLDVFRIDGATWRVSDPSADMEDPRRILGYIERLSRNRYEVLWLAPVAWAYVSTFDLAIQAITDRSLLGDAVRRHREIPAATDRA